MKNTKLYPHQKEALDCVTKEFERASRCHIVMACGTGKTLTSLAVYETMKPKTTVVFVPSLALINQSMKTWVKESEVPNEEFLIVCSSDSIADDIEQESLLLEPVDFPITTNADEISEFVHSVHSSKVIFCTYQSSQLLQGLDIDFGIFDEAHKTAGHDKKQFSFSLDDSNVRIGKRLFITATPRHTSRQKDQEDKLVYSMDNEEVYGKRAYTLTFRDSINRGLICDYKVIISVVDTGNIIEQDNKQEFGLTEKAVALSKAIKETNSKKVITFHSSIKNASEFSNEYKKKFEGSASIFHISSKLNIEQRSGCMSGFRDAERSIISNARCLTEGVDVPTVDMVAFLNPKSSKIDIVQAIGRALRTSPGKKFGYIFLPLMIDEKDINNIEFTQYSSVWQVLKALMEQDSELDDIIKEASKNKGLNPDSKQDKIIGFERFFDVQSSSQLIENLINVRILDNIGSSWYEMYGQLVAYKEKYGHCNVTVSE